MDPAAKLSTAELETGNGKVQGREAFSIDGSGFPSLKVILFMLGPRAAYRPILYSQNEIFCGPDCRDDYGHDGQVRQIRTPAGSHDVATIKPRIGWNDPDLVVVKADATGRNFPVNLSIFHCPKVLVVGNTQHLDSPIQRLLAYAQQEKFDFIASDHKRHHLHFFVEAGFPKVAWLPGLNVYPHPQPTAQKRTPHVLFVGQTGKFHPYRNYILGAIRESGLPLQVVSAPQEQAAALYARSLIALNCSLNGDLNLRVFEILSSGGFLLTDRLAPEAGLELLFKEGHAYEAWSDAGELIEKARHYLDHPKMVETIAERGCEAFWAKHHPHRKAAELMKWVFDDNLPVNYVMTLDLRTVVVPVGTSASVSARAAIYEEVQEQHLCRPRCRVLVGADVDAHVVLDLADLPRAELTVTGSKAEMSPEVVSRWARAKVGRRVKWLGKNIDPGTADPWDVMVLSQGAGQLDVVAKVLEHMAFEVTFVEPPEITKASGLAAGLASIGFFSKGAGNRFFHCEQPSLQGQALINQGNRRKAMLLLKAAVDRHPDDPDWLVDTAVLAIKLGQGELAELCLRTAMALRPTHGQARKLLAVLYRHFSRERDAIRIEEVLDIYPRGCSVEPVGALLAAKRILVINNLFPPQELGGYGRLLADFTEILRIREHEVHVLSSDTGYLGPKPDHEPGVDRSLRLFGGWQDGIVHTDNATEAAKCAVENMHVVARNLRNFRPDVCLLGNIDFVGYPIIQTLLEARVPVLHHLGNEIPGYPVADCPKSPLYRLATASVWLARKVIEAGFPLPSVDVIYPGALVEAYRCGTLPTRDSLRIAYASIILPYKGAQILIAALAELHRRNIPFSCTIAGTTTDPKFIEGLKAIIENVGMTEKVTFTGFLDRVGLKHLFKTHNVLAFPSLFDEPFGISQVEAMAAGMVVLSSGTGGASEVVEHEQSGLVVPRGDAMAMAAAFTSLLQDPDRWQKLAEEGQRRASKFFDIRRSVDQIEEIFTQLLESVQC